MSEEMIHYTLQIFERLIREIPPLTPKQIRDDMHQALEQMQHNVSLTETELEETMIIFGKKIWPYRQAFLEFFRISESILGEKIFLKKASAGLKKKYMEFKASGGSFRDMYRGGPALFFTPDERLELNVLMVEIYQEVKDHTRQSVLSVERQKYKKRIKDFHMVLQNIEDEIGRLRQMADNEQQHPELADEIREHVRGFEQGICLLGPSIDYTAVYSSQSHFEQRREYQKLTRRANMFF
ncbi:MAG: hypothetical protein COV59_04645 [Candidatus Magasanikbacteria bacterium CG11_big_fil_rev_8_21_14_0_20_39_34]|uniref:Uncharacterized protein n=1 Tax=Candidatus Magasanikbacteria bacterium CG11_big_fil_rev_8_21_14_0_20_39_34 TaxID=1974653 RepID=A0A2H0N4B0_9BACT|nr:MAG: hypothetical protein COV59_04645 [Candidatus Magasanikbacteria bacterium CG11_big_fil_rev_8_21_14_0_20_39_34]